MQVAGSFILSRRGFPKVSICVSAMGSDDRVDDEQAHECPEHYGGGISQWERPDVAMGLRRLAPQ